MNNLIYQCHVGNHDHVKYSVDHFKKYADIHEVQYCFENRRFNDYKTKHIFNLTFEKLRPIVDKTFDLYDNILVVDTDVLISKPYKNIFDVNFYNIAMVYDHELSKHYKHNHFNSGVVLTTKPFRQRYREEFNKWQEFLIENSEDLRSTQTSDEYFIKKTLRDNQIDVTFLSKIWNCWYRNSGNVDYAFLHFCNTDKKHMKQMYKVLENKWK